ncbi:MAG: caspase family protein [Phormidesmis sp. CAN_BIN44]|nr:caspase family protein [Phormidesmis sp. CAN_BIN44]
MSRDALIVGIRVYDPRSRLGSLDSASEDAKAIEQILTQYGSFRVRKLLNEVSQVALEAAINQLFNPDTNNENTIPETALLFFAGHGLRKKVGVSEGYLATSDVNPNENRWGVHLGWLQKLLRISPVRQQVIWLDCCYSGELLNDFNQDLREATPGYLGKRDRCFIAASRDYEAAYGTRSRGVLTNALLQALDPTQHSDGRVTSWTLKLKVEEALRLTMQNPICDNSGDKIILTQINRVESSRIASGVCPYKGLEYFDFNEEDPKYFYGRDPLISELLEKVRTSNFVAVLGASGSGKSSVVRAGLLHQLKLGERVAGSSQWSNYIFRPGDQPLQNLAEAFVPRSLSEIDFAVQLKKAQDLVNAGAMGLGQLITASKASRVVLVVDQFEECFAPNQDSVKLQPFFECLLEAIARPDNKLCLVLTLRADFFGKCLEYADLANHIKANLIAVEPMKQGELAQAITEPAKRVGLDIETELIDQMLRDVADAPGSLPLLQYTLKLLWERKSINWLTLATYNDLGRVEGALEQRANQIYDSLSLEEQEAARCIFLELTQLGAGTENTRRQVAKRDLITLKQPEALIDRVIQRLSAERLVVTSELVGRSSNSEHTEVIDIAHEALINHWKKLQDWIEANQADLKRKRTLEEKAKEWRDSGQRSELAYLLQGSKLIEAEDFLQAHADTMPLSSLAQEFIQISQAERDRLQREEEERQQREYTLLKERVAQEERARKAAQKTVGVAIGATVLVSIAAGGFWLQRSQAIEREISSLNAASEAQLSNHNQLEALITSVEAGKKLKANWVSESVRLQTVATLQQAVYETQERNRLERHGDRVNRVSYSPDGQLLASASDDKTVIIWRRDGTLLRKLEGHTGYVRGVTFSRNGQFLASASADRTIKLWKSDGTLVKTFSGHENEVDSVRFSPDGKTLASASRDETVKLWQLDSNQVKPLKGHVNWVNDISFSSDGKLLASASKDGTIKLWNVATGRLTRTLKGHKDDVTSVSFSPDSKTLASASRDRTVRVWKRDGTLVEILDPEHSGSVNSVSFSPDGKTLASGSFDRTIKLWNIIDRTQLAVLEGHADSVTSVSFSADSKTLASASADGTIKIWNLEEPHRRRFDTRLDSGSFSPDGQTFAVADCKGKIQLWHPDDWFAAKPPFHKFSKAHNDCINSVRFSPDGKTIASAGDDNTLKLWSVEGKLLKTLPKQSEPVFSLDFSQDGKLASGGDDRTIKLWNAETGELLQELKGHGDRVSSVDFSSDGKILASGSHDKTLRLWHLDSRSSETLGSQNQEISAVQFDPTGKILASASWDKTVELWDIEKKTQIKALTGHQGLVTDLSFSPSGQALVSSSDDSTLKLWDVAEGTLLKTLKGHQNQVTSVSFSPKGNALLSTSDDSVILWNLDLQDLLNQGCDRLHDYLQTNLKEDDRNLCPS